VYKWTGIDVSVGIARTKTLAKIANERAKKTTGCIVLTDKKDIENILKNTDVEDIWGIGHRLKKRLYMLGIYSANDLASAQDTMIKQKLSVNGLKTTLELREVKCFKLDESPSSKKSICSSRSFANKLEHLNELKEAISSYISIAAKKLKREKMIAGFIVVFISTSFHSKDPFYSNSCQIALPIATSYTPDLIKYAHIGLKKIFKKGFLYKKAGVILSDFSNENFLQQDLFTKLPNENKKYLMKIMDDLNYKANKKALYFASDGIDKKYKSSSNLRSLKYTTSFDELIKVR